jgi:hypothetical protein
MLNRETPVLLPLVWLLYRWDELPLATLLARFAGFCAEAFAAYFALRFALGEHAAYAEFNDFHLNLVSFNSYFYFFILFGAMAGPALKGLAGKPKFLRRAAAFLPFFLVFHFVIPIFQETRLFLPIFPIVLALALLHWVEAKPGTAESDNKSGGFSPANPRALYAGLFVLFIAAMIGYLAYLEKAHVRDLEKKQRAEMHLKLGNEAAANNAFSESVRNWERGLIYDPENFDLHFNLAAAYAERFFDVDRAEKHVEACRRVSPDDPRVQDLAKRIQILRAERKRMF